MSGTKVVGMLALLAGCLSCAGTVLVFPFCVNVVQVWHGRSPSRLPEALAFGVPLAVCIVLALASLAWRSDRPGSGAPGTLALALIGLQLLVFLTGMSFFSY